jgi:hypothetical protein
MADHVVNGVIASAEPRSLSMSCVVGPGCHCRRESNVEIEAVTTTVKLAIFNQNGVPDTVIDAPYRIALQRLNLRQRSLGVPP